MKRIAWIPLMLCLFWCSAASAQRYAGGPPPRPGRVLYRDGLVLGIALGAGRAGWSCDGCNSYGGFAGEFHIGGMITHQLALEGDFSTVVRSVGYDQFVSVNMAHFAAQFWPAQILWLKAGIGLGVLSYDDNYYGYSASSNAGVSALFGVGVEVLQTYNFALDIQFRVTGTRFDNDTINTVALMIGATWF
jgi:hypothetical protein